MSDVPFIPRLTFWLAEDGRIFSGIKQMLVTAEDGDYVKFVAYGLQPRAWPRDADGDQTTAALQDVLTPFGMFADLSAYAADARWRNETGGITIAGVPVATDDRSKQMIIGARVAADADPNWTSQWVGADGAIYPIDAAAIIAISNAVQAHVNACFATFATVKAEIDAGAITTTAEIDAAFAV